MEFYGASPSRASELQHLVTDELLGLFLKVHEMYMFPFVSMSGV